MGTYRYENSEQTGISRPTLLDNSASLCGIERHVGESDNELKIRILDTYSNKSNSSVLGLVNTLSRELKMPKVRIARMDSPLTTTNPIYVDYGQFLLREINILTKEIVTEITLYESNVTIRQSNSIYTINDYVIHPLDSTKWLKCVVEGTTSLTQPDFTKEIGDLIEDNEVLWIVVQELPPKSAQQVADEYNDVSETYTMELIDEMYVNLPAPFIIPFTSAKSINMKKIFSKVTKLNVNILPGTFQFIDNNIYTERPIGSSLTSTEYCIDYENGIITFGVQPENEMNLFYIYNSVEIEIIYFPIKLFSIFSEDARKTLMLPIFDSDGQQVNEISLINDEELDKAYLFPSNRLKVIKKDLESLYPLLWDNSNIMEL